MNPLFLRMKAFGSYLRDTTIDFTKLGEHPLFLITGATGGGKTTILDAMCFALYCRATGGRRSWSGMRSLSAAQEEETLVEFTFSCRAGQYRWLRSIQPYYSKRADTVKQKETHECYQKAEDGTWKLLCAGSETRVREQAEQLLGLTCEQFSQVVVLPQGDFLKLLLATSKEKASLLQTLFATERWSRVTQRMRERVAAVAKQAGQNDAARASLLQREQVADAAALQEKCGQLRLTGQSLQRQLAAAQKQLAAANEKYDLAARAAQAYDRWKACAALLQSAHARVRRTAEEERQAQVALAQGPHLQEQAAAAREQAARLQDALQAVRKRDALLRQVQREQEQIRKAEKGVKAAEEAQRQAQAHWEKGMAFSNALQQQVEQLPVLTKQLEEELQHNAAAVIAGDLKPECPCPVCGSTVHPHPAKASTRIEELRHQQEEAARAAKTLQKARKRIQELELQRQQAQEQGRVLRENLQGLQRQYAADAAAAKEVETQTLGGKRAVELERQIRELREKAAQLQQQENHLQRVAANAQSAAAAAVEALQKAQEDEKTTQEQYRGALQAYRAQPGAPQDTERPDDAAARRERETAQEQAAKLAGAAGRAAENLRSARQSAEQLEKLEKTGEQLHRIYEETSRLADCLSGRTRQRVPIQQFVLGMMLEDILASANRFFAGLSAGRYQLRRRTAPAGGHALGGLDLLVLDAASGGEREVGTLSGGELFLASLSLAFGLSDIVQAYSGAVRLDSLFIDEGFGSLDQETLDTAMGALLRLQKAGRTVGIISHVTELQEVIPKQLVVSRLPDGSSAVAVVAEEAPKA